MKKFTAFMASVMMLTMLFSMNVFAANVEDTNAAPNGAITSRAYLQDDEIHYVMSYNVREGDTIVIQNTYQSIGTARIYTKDSNGEFIILGEIARGEKLQYVAPCNERNMKLYLQRVDCGDGWFVGISWLSRGR